MYMSGLWKRFLYVAACGALLSEISLGRACKASALAPPETAGDWRLAAPTDCRQPVPPEFQIWRGTARASRVCRASYAGPVPVTLTLYDMSGFGASTFDAFQKFRVEPGKQAFYGGGYFGVAEAPADIETLHRFVVTVQSGLGRK